MVRMQRLIFSKHQDHSKDSLKIGESTMENLRKITSIHGIKTTCQHSAYLAVNLVHTQPQTHLSKYFKS